MPTTFYSEEEYDRLRRKCTDMHQQVAVLEQLRPVWAQGYTEDGRAAQGYANALSELWKMLGAKNQTEACQKLKALIDHREKVPF